MKLGSLNAGLIWLISIVVIGASIGAAYATAGASAKVSNTIFFGVFALGGFAATGLTKAKTGLGILALILASIGTSIIYYFIVSSTVAQVGEAMGGAEGAAAGSLMGAAMGIFACVMVFISTMVAGIGGCVVGAKVKNKALA